MTNEENTIKPDQLSNKIDHLGQELSNLHSHVTCGTDNKVNFLNQQFWQLKKLMFHSDFPVDLLSFNGQFSKHRMFSDICNAIQFDRFIETGTNLGETARFLAKCGKQVLTIEINPEFFATSQSKLKQFDNVEIFLGDSVEVLDQQISNKEQDKNLFFYLDAHWYDYIPLHKEIDLVFSRAPNSVVFVDDFKVPDDDGYGFDQYDDVSLDIDYISQKIDKWQLQAFFPAMPSSKDHCWIDVIKPRGTVILAKSKKIIEKLSGLKSLRTIDR